MSKVRLTGSTSGYTEIQASAVAGDNTLNLPTTANGTLVAADSSGNVNLDSGTLYVDAANDRVGVGTESPGHKLDLIGTTTSAFRIRSSSVASRGFEFWNNSATDEAYISNYYSGPIIFQTNNDEKARIDSSGRLLIGTSSARESGSLFETEQIGTSYKSAVLTTNSNTGGTYSPHLFFNRSRGTSAGSVTVVNNGDRLGTLLFKGADGAAFQTAAQITAEVDGTPSANDMPGRLVFSTTADGASSPTERLRITENGTFYFYTYNGSPPSTTNFGISFGRASAGSTSPGRIECYRNVNGTGIAQQFGGSAGQVYIKGDGDLENTNNSYTGISDIKLKENIINAGSQWDDLKALQVRKYNFKAETGYNTHTQIGLVAQEVELVSPGLVGESINEETGESTKSVNYSVLYMKAVKALQEAMERIETLEAANTDLAARITALEAA